MGPPILGQGFQLHLLRSNCKGTSITPPSVPFTTASLLPHHPVAAPDRPASMIVLPVPTPSPPVPQCLLSLTRRLQTHEHRPGHAHPHNDGRILGGFKA
jgi:hypothetical protein